VMRKTGTSFMVNNIWWEIASHVAKIMWKGPSVQKPGEQERPDVNTATSVASVMTVETDVT